MCNKGIESRGNVTYVTSHVHAGALVLGDFKTNTKLKDVQDKGEVEEVSEIRDALLKDDEYYGTYLYINFMHRYELLVPVD